jgi:hypothetical protein
VAGQCSLPQRGVTSSQWWFDHISQFAFPYIRCRLSRNYFIL